MANYNDVLVDPENFVVANKVCLDPTTILTPPPAFTVPQVNHLTVANGSVVQVYDVSNPSSPVLIGTIG
jgi:hypothetical protein